MSCGCLKYGLTLSLLCVVTSKNSKNLMESVQPADSPVKVTAVLINCEIDDIQKESNEEDNRFEREELFKHNALRDCDKKLALTIKLTTKSANSADEYVPIDHVVDGRSRRRVRLLNPYVLRLRRDAPLEAYRLKFIETVSGLLATSKEENHKNAIEQTRRIRRDTNGVLNVMDDWRTNSVMPEPKQVFPARVRYAFRLAGAAAAFSAGSILASSQARVHKENNKISVHPAGRVKRHEKNVIIEEENDLYRNKEITQIFHDAQLAKAADDITKGDKNEVVHIRKETDSAVLNDITNWNCKPQPQCRFKDNAYIGNLEREFALYKIEEPTLWFYVHVHLFEKLSTLKGNTLWNDITKGVPVSLSSMSPEWSSSDMNVQYKPADRVAREDFFLPTSSLRLLVPLLEENVNAISNITCADDANYLLVPTEDVLDVDKTINTDKASTPLANVSSNCKKECRRKVIVRVARALNNDMADKISVVNQASDKFLTKRHRGIRHAQVDLEARADDNQLVHERYRQQRKLLRAQIRDCDSDLMKLSANQLNSENQEEDMTSEAVSLPPRHTRRLQLRLQPFPPGENAQPQHCTVYLLNEDGESVAVRDALIKKGDHCYCVWHCDCICYGDNPRLPCREMSAARQDAAGLPARRGARFARACSYADVTTINVAVVIIGVIGMLLFLGVLKGLLGLLWPRAGVWGLDWILEEPRPIDRYRERCLRARQVVHDAKGWPVHPDTRKRTVRVVSLPVEFILNVVFFMVTPGLVAVDTLKHLTKGKSCHVAEGKSHENFTKRCKETLSRRHQSQGHKLPTRHQLLPRRSWMTPGAEDLATTVWENNSTMIARNNAQSSFPLVQHDHQRPELGPGLASEGNSDQEDTAFVLMRMKESSESLARNQVNLDTNSPINATCHVTATQSAPAAKENLIKP